MATTLKNNKEHWGLSDLRRSNLSELMGFFNQRFESRNTHTTSKVEPNSEAVGHGEKSNSIPDLIIEESLDNGK